MWVHPAVQDQQTGAVTPMEQGFLLYAVLGGVYADSPARAKLMYTLASRSAYLACPFCLLSGSMVDGVVRYLGVAAAVQVVRGLGLGKSYSMAVNDSARLVSSDSERVRALVAEQFRVHGVQPPDDTPFKGYTPFFDLYWVDANRLWLVPFYHAFFLGIYKDFLDQVFAKGEQVGCCQDRPCCWYIDYATPLGYDCPC